MAESVYNVDSWTVEQLKEFLRDRNINLSGNKSELVRKVADIIATDDLENELEALPFQSVETTCLMLPIGLLKVFQLF